VFSKCCFEVLTGSCRASPWDVSGLPILSSSHVILGEWVERAQQLQDVSSLLWTNMAVPSVAEFRYSLLEQNIKFLSVFQSRERDLVRTCF
jgi:midasin